MNTDEIIADGIKFKSINGEWVPVGKQVIAEGALTQEMIAELLNAEIKEPISEKI